MVRLAHLALAALAFALALGAWTPAAQAGTAEAPEIVDPANDHELSPAGEALFGLGPACDLGAPCFNRDDVLAVWFDQDVAASFNVNILLANAPVSATQYVVQYDFRATGAADQVVSTVTTTTAEPALGDNVAAAAVDGNTLILTISKDIYGGAAALTDVSVLARALFIAPSPLDVELSRDRAPDSDGIAYSFGGAGGNGTAGDSDGDGLNDTEEQEQFGNTTAQNGTGDPDSDGLNNSAEFAAGTNATNPDTDGDGVDDGDDPFPLDPDRPGGGSGGNGTGNGTGNATADLDGDDLPDSWERDNFNSTAQDGDGDPDDDGLDNLAEYEAGTDPSDADTDGDGLNDLTDPDPLEASGENDRLEMYAGAPLFAAIATLCLFGLARK